MPQSVYNENKKVFDPSNFDVVIVDNLISLAPTFHSKHQAYSTYIAKHLTQLAEPNVGKLTSQQ